MLPVFPEVQVLVVRDLAILSGLGKAVDRPSDIINQISSLGPSKFSACYIIEGFWTFWQTAAAASVHRSRSQRHLIAKPPKNVHLMEPPNSTGKKQTHQGL